MTDPLAFPIIPCFFMSSKSPIAGNLWFCLFKKGLRPAPVQSELHNHIFICIFTNQLELLYNNQSEHRDIIQSNCMIWNNQKCRNWKPHLHKMEQLGIWVGTVSIKEGLPFVSVEHTFDSHQRLHFNRFTNFQLNQASFPTHLWEFRFTNKVSFNLNI